jgi:hypothetical protein
MAALDKTMYGFVEKVILVDQQLQVSAKLDTGAKSASLSAVHIQRIEKDGKAYLQFIVPSKQGNIPFTCEYVGKVQIKPRVGENQSALSPEPLRRPVVLLRVRLGDKEATIPVNLTNRKRFIYPLLLGRDAIQSFQGIVDPSITFTVKYPKVNKHAT